MLLPVLLVSLTLQIVGFYLGCKNQCFLTHEQLKKFLIINRIISLVLYVSWVSMNYGSIFQSNMLYNSIALLLLIIGQYLNVTVYQKLGADLVYYGREYDIQGEYMTGFPFNMKHPQYMGTILTTIGTFFLTGFNKNGSVRKTNLYVLSYIIVLYLISMSIENDCHKKKC